MKFLVGEKIKQEQAFDEQFRRMVVTHIKVQPMHIIGFRTVENDGYWAIRVGYGVRRAKHTKKPLSGELKKAGVETAYGIKEIRVADATLSEDGKKLTVGEMNYDIGQELVADTMIQAGDVVEVEGVTKGKGFLGVVRRHNFAGGPKTHGQSDRHRAPGSIGQRMTPGRVFKGLRMAGKTGGNKITVKGLHVVSLKENMLVLRGTIPGAPKSYVTIHG